LNAHGFDLIAEFESVDPIAISHEICRCRIEREGFYDSLSRPFRRRVSRNVEVENAPPVTGEHDEHKQNFEPNRGFGEKGNESKPQ